MGCGGSIASGSGKAVAGKYNAHWDVEASSCVQALSTSGLKGVSGSTGSQPPRRPSGSRRKNRSDMRQTCSGYTIPADVKRLNLGSFEQQDVLVQTEVATIIRLRHQEGGHLLAGKRIERGCSARTVQRFVNEVVRLQALAATACVVGFRGICECPSEFWLITDLCGGGSIDSWLSRWPATTRGVVRQLLEAVQHLHSCLVCHLDLKPSAILLTDAGRVRLCGLGDACKIQQEGQVLFGISGSPGFQAPEVQGCSGYCGVRADVYSLGRTLKVATCHETMWGELAEVRLKMMSEDPAQRPSLAAAADSLFSCGWTPPSTGDEQLRSVEQMPPPRRGSHIRRSRSSTARRSNCQLDAVNTGIEGDSNYCSGGSRRDGAQGRSDGNTQEPCMVPKPGKQNDARIQFQPRRLPPLPRSCTTPVLHQPSEGMGDVQSPSGRLQTLPCGSALCARLDSCLCHDRLPSQTSTLKSGFTNDAGNHSVGAKMLARCPARFSLGDLDRHHRNRSLSPGRSRSIAGSTREFLARGAHGSMELLE